MKKNRDNDNFEERLLGELKAVVAQRGTEQEVSAESTGHSHARQRAPRLAIGAVAVLAVGAALLIVNSGGDHTTRAFAVEPQDGGGVAIKIYSPEDSAGLEAALGEAGIRSQVTWLPAGMTCREPHFTPSTVRTSLGGTIGGMRMGGPGAITIGVMSAQQWHERWRQHMRGEISDDEFQNTTANISLDPASFRTDQTVVISGSPGPYDGDPEGGHEVNFAIAEGPVEPCQPVRAPDGGLLGEMNRVLGSESAQGRG